MGGRRLSAVAATAVAGANAYDASWEFHQERVQGGARACPASSHPSQKALAEKWPAYVRAHVSISHESLGMRHVPKISSAWPPKDRQVQNAMLELTHDRSIFSL